ncbi:nitroreductase family protein [Accumulibacter sp.]|uniref:nitroreductase family protein n=1 Tax=Accumulibacter sp. TaxID=2053492 RepID=UPI0025F88D16|nr:nitroreductase family protein [Accumulibacter sp.]MCM8624870.1 nitroreductase family protein [Accumulibacter sp.]
MRNPLQYVAKALSFLREYATDMWLFIKHNNHSPLEDRNRKAYFQTIILSHTIEKGLSLAMPRPLFGRNNVDAIVAQLRSYSKAYSEFPVGMATGALAAYRDFSADHAAADDPTLSVIERYLDSEAAPGVERTGGVKQVDAAGTVFPQSIVDFLKSRTSCRMFVPDALPREQVDEVLTIAQSAPSQCNRQSVRVHFYQERARIASLLRLQAGAAGFSENVGNLFVVTSEITAWGGPQQRNQMYVDGGLYAMMLMLACHSQGIASCPLNLAVTNAVERKIKTVGDISANQRLIMMIAVGKTSAPRIKAARSPRCRVAEVARFH